MKLPSFRRLISSDYQSQFRQLVDTLSVSLNNGIEVIYEALNGDLSLRDNISCTVKDVTVSVDASGNPLQTSSFALNSTAKVDGVTVISALNQTNTTHFPTSGVFVSGAQSSNVYNINNITGLQANESYIIRVVAWQQ